MNARRPIVGGNWKMHMLSEEASSYCDALVTGDETPVAEGVIFPPFTLLSLVSGKLADSWAECGGQDLHPEAHDKGEGFEKYRCEIPDLEGGAHAEHRQGQLYCGKPVLVFYVEGAHAFRSPWLQCR